MTKSQIKAELRRIAVEEKYPLGHMLLRKKNCINELFDFQTRHQSIYCMKRLHLRVFMLLVAEAL